MSAKDYEICPALFSAYIAKTSKKNKGMMTDDRREITEGEIMMLVDWYLDKNTKEGTRGVSFPSHTRKGKRIEMVFADIKE